jgi:hypothetical protein
MTWTALPITSAGRFSPLGPLGIVLSQCRKAILNLLKRCREFGNRWLELRTASASGDQRTSLKDFDLPLNIGARF